MAEPTRQPEPTKTYAGPTFQKLKSRVLESVGWTLDDAPIDTISQIEDLLNEAVAQIAMLCPGLVHLEKYYEVPVVSGEDDAVLPLGLIYIHDPIVVGNVPVYELPQEYRNRLKSAGTDGTNEVTQKYYTVFGLNNAGSAVQRKPVITWHPVPTENATAKLYASGLDDALSSPNDIVRIPVAFASAPEWFAKITILQSRGRLKDATFAANLWENALGKIKGMGLRARTRGRHLQWPNFVKSGRGRLFPGTSKVIP